MICDDEASAQLNISNAVSCKACFSVAFQFDNKKKKEMVRRSTWLATSATLRAGKQAGHASPTRGLVIGLLMILWATLEKHCEKENWFS